MLAHERAGWQERRRSGSAVLTCCFETLRRLDQRVNAGLVLSLFRFKCTNVPLGSAHHNAIDLARSEALRAVSAVIEKR